MVETAGLENRYARKGIEGSNPSLSVPMPTLQRIRRIVAVVVGVILFLVVAVLGVAQLRWDRTFTVPPVPIAASRDPATVARGRYLAYGPAHCVDCHVAPEQVARFDSGGEPPLSGGYLFAIPPGRFYAPNITPDLATGIGRRTDAQLAQMIRYGVRADGRVALPFMDFKNLSDEDVTALISFLRSQPPVLHPVPANDLSLLGKMVFAFMMKPQTPDSTPPARTPAAGTLASGAYLARVVTECAGCHTQRSLTDGSYKSPMFAGGGVFSVDTDPNLELVTPNLTPDSATGRMAHWTEDQFVTRFRAGKSMPQSIMPWTAFQRMTDADLRAIYQYLHALPPVSYDPGPSLRRKR